jgi:hypothetical protein
MNENHFNHRIIREEREKREKLEFQEDLQDLNKKLPDKCPFCQSESLYYVEEWYGIRNPHKIVCYRCLKVFSVDLLIKKQ